MPAAHIGLQQPRLYRIEETFSAERGIGNGTPAPAIRQQRPVQYDDRFASERLGEQVTTVRQRLHQKRPVLQHHAQQHVPAAVANGSRQAAHESRRNQRRHRAKQRGAERDRAHQHAARKRPAQQHAERKQQPAEKTGGDEQRQYRARQIAWRVHERQGRRHAQCQLARQPVKHGQRRQREERIHGAEQRRGKGQPGSQPEAADCGSQPQHQPVHKQVVE